MSASKSRALHTFLMEHIFICHRMGCNCTSSFKFAHMWRTCPNMYPESREVGAILTTEHSMLQWLLRFEVSKGLCARPVTILLLNQGTYICSSVAPKKEQDSFRTQNTKRILRKKYINLSLTDYKRNMAIIRSEITVY